MRTRTCRPVLVVAGGLLGILLGHLYFSRPVVYREFDIGHVFYHNRPMRREPTGVVTNATLSYNSFFGFRLGESAFGPSPIPPELRVEEANATSSRWYSGVGQLHLPGGLDHVCCMFDTKSHELFCVSAEKCVSPPDTDENIMRDIEAIFKALNLAYSNKVERTGLFDIENPNLDTYAKYTDANLRIKLRAVKIGSPDNFSLIRLSACYDPYYRAIDHRKESENLQRDDKPRDVIGELIVTFFYGSFIEVIFFVFPLAVIWLIEFMCSCFSKRRMVFALSWFEPLIFVALPNVLQSAQHSTGKELCNLAELGILSFGWCACLAVRIYLGIRKDPPSKSFMGLVTLAFVLLAACLVGQYYPILTWD